MYAHRPTHVEIDLTALKHNYQLLCQRLPAACSVLAVVKADAYGHGALPVAKVLQQEGADLLGVAIAEEGLELRQGSIDIPILMMGGSFPGQEEIVVSNDLQVVVFDVEQLIHLEAAAAKLNKLCRCHLKVDTGMGRLGVLPVDLDDVLVTLRNCPHLCMEGVMSHFAVADLPNHPYTLCQLELFLECVERVRGAGFNPKYIHSANSAASFDVKLNQGECGCNLVRSGIALYGGQPFSDAEEGLSLPLQPVMSLRTVIAQLKQFPAGSSISYGRRFVTSRPSLIATIPVGYADGYNRQLSNVGQAVVRGQRVTVAGAVCMDWTLLDVTDVAGVSCGDEVTLLGCADGECILAEQWAQQVGTISYEVFCQISKRVPRHYLGASQYD
ncbi:MAG: alanine racemase [Desulfobacteraceae bacterium 4572_35.1]|nr:MAG: alanine racemase [Desulfobacteraceae bacterium 4572_35.1]